MKSIILWCLQFLIIVLIFLMKYISGDVNSIIFMTVLNWGISFFILNNKEINILNLSTFFWIGLGLFILGRPISYTISNISLEEVFDASFFINETLNKEAIIELMIFINLTLLSLCLGSCYGGLKSPKKNNDRRELFIDGLYIIVLYVLMFFYLENIMSMAIKAISEGYMALYQGQGEEYGTPFQLVFNSLFIAMLSLIFVKKKYKHFRLIFLIFVISNILSILTGGRGSFVSVLLMTLWYLFYKKRLKLKNYIVIILIPVFLFISTDYIAGLSGARDTGDPSVGFLGLLSNAFYSQGFSMFVVNSSIYLESPPILGYVKTIIPGIQILFSFLGVNQRYEFDWASYLAYTKDAELYYQGFGLGWSIFSDLYLLSFSLLPLYLFFIFLLGFFLKMVSLRKESSLYFKGLNFLLIFYIFMLSRASISPVIFTIAIYSTLYLIFIRKAKI